MNRAGECGSGMPGAALTLIAGLERRGAGRDSFARKLSSIQRTSWGVASERIPK